MQLNEYQTRALTTSKEVQLSLGASVKTPWIYPALGLAGESGEVLDKVKKLVRDHSNRLTHNGRIPDDLANPVMLELGDVLWYLSDLAHRLGFTLEEVAQANLNKLAARKKNNTLHGEGDYR